MASSSDENIYNDSETSTSSYSFKSHSSNDLEDSDFSLFDDSLYGGSHSNIVHKIINRQLYGRINRRSRSNTEQFFKEVHHKCRYKLARIIPREAVRHIFMGFTICSKFFISYTTKLIPPAEGSIFHTFEYYLYIWRFIPGQKLQFLNKHRIYKLYKDSIQLYGIMVMQFPTDPYKIICYATAGEMAFLTVLTLPTNNCKSCKSTNIGITSDKFSGGWCSKHGFIIHFMFTFSNPEPAFDPQISLAYPDHIVINTGHSIHILNFHTIEPVRNQLIFNPDYETKLFICSCTDNLSEISESLSEVYSGSNSIVDAISEDFGEYDLESSEHGKPFHELNITCDPLNVTGKTYHSTLMHNIVDPRIKHVYTASNNKDYLFSIPQSSGHQKQLEKINVDKNIAEKTYEFTEDTEKCEKLSLFRKKRLADKKYEFSEDNSENIVPFYSLRREKKCLYRPQNYYIKSPEFKSLFLSPRSPGLRSPMQSPNSRSGQFSPVASRNISCSVRTNPHFSKTSVSPKDSARKINVYSPGLDSDCSDSESRLILRPVQNCYTAQCDSKLPFQNSLLMPDPKQDTPKWIKKVVKRFSGGDFESSSMLSGHSRDDYNVQIELPILVQGLSEQNFDIIPEAKADHVLETQLIVTQRTLDYDQFVQNRARKLCIEAQLEFLHCEDYDIKIIDICPLNGHIICKAVIAIGALEDVVPYVKRNVYVTDFIFTWNIVDNTFNVIEPSQKLKLQSQWTGANIPSINVPSILCRKILVLDHINEDSKNTLRDYNNFYEISLNGNSSVLSDELSEFSPSGDSSDFDF